MMRNLLFGITLALALFSGLSAQTYDTPGITAGGGGDTVNAPVAFASIPACSTSEFFQPLNDSFYDMAYCDGSSNLTYYLDGVEITPPPTTGWSWVNQGSSTIATSGGMQVLSIPGAASLNVRMRARSIPSAPYTVTMGFTWAFENANFAQCGIYLRNASGGTISGYFTGDGGGTGANKLNSATSFGSNYTTKPVRLGDRVMLRLEDNSTNRIFSVSRDLGKTWFESLSVSRTDFHTPDEIGFACNSENSDPATMTIFHWLEE